MRLQDELTGTENRIAVARSDYNGAVNTYNSYIRQFPAVMTAKMTGAKPRKYFTADANGAAGTADGRLLETVCGRGHSATGSDSAGDDPRYAGGAGEEAVTILSVMPEDAEVAEDPWVLCDLHVLCVLALVVRDDLGCWRLGLRK